MVRNLLLVIVSMEINQSNFENDTSTSMMNIENVQQIASIIIATYGCRLWSESEDRHQNSILYRFLTDDHSEHFTIVSTFLFFCYIVLYPHLNNQPDCTVVNVLLSFLLLFIFIYVTCNSCMCFIFVTSVYVRSSFTANDVHYVKPYSMYTCIILRGDVFHCHVIHLSTIIIFDV